MERLGIVYIAARAVWQQTSPPFTGYWDRGDPPEMLEQGPGWERAEDAIGWGRERAPRVMVRLGATNDTIYSAGESDLGEIPDGSGRRYPHWPPDGS